MKVAVLGGGPGGYVAAVRAAQLGADVTLVEEDALGGTCLNRGCIPSKVFKAAAELLERQGRAGEFGILSTGEARVDMGALQGRKRRILQMEQRGIESLLKRNRVTLVRGMGRVAGAGRLWIRNNEGREAEVTWDRLIMATGSRPAGLTPFPFNGRTILSSDDALSLANLPTSLVIVGGGVIGCEFASIFSSLGVQVTIVEALERLLPLPSVDEACSKTLQREMKKRKIRLYTGRIVETVEETSEGLRVALVPSPFGESPPGESPVCSLKTERLLVCIGRAPRTENIGLETLGLSPGPKGWIQVDEGMMTGTPGVYAVGDVLGPERVMLAHVASMEGMVAAENVMGANRRMDYTAVPSAIFTTPEVATVGLTEARAKDLGVDFRAETVLFRTNSKAHVMGEISGQVKIVSEKGTGKILGVHMVGPHVTDLIAEGVLAVQAGLTVRQLARTLHAHPTLSEVMLETAYKWLEMPIHG